MVLLLLLSLLFVNLLVQQQLDDLADVDFAALAACDLQLVVGHVLRAQLVHAVLAHAVELALASAGGTRHSESLHATTGESTKATAWELVDRCLGWVVHRIDLVVVILLHVVYFDHAQENTVN